MTPMRMAALAFVTTLVAPTAGGQDTPPRLSPRMAELARQLKDPDPEIRMEAATALSFAGAEARAAIPQLVEALQDPVAPVRMKAIDALMYLKTAAAAAAPRIVPLLNDPDELVRVSAVMALPRVSADRASAVPLLKKALSDRAWPVRRRAAIELIHLGAETGAAVPVLREGLKDPIPPHRLEVMAVLAEVASPEERKALRAMIAEHLGHPDRDIRVAAIQRLGGLGAEGVPHLIAVVRAEGEARAVQSIAIGALGQIGPDAKEALPVLQELEKQKGPLRSIARRAIAGIEGKEPRPPEHANAPVPSLERRRGRTDGRPARPATPAPSPTPSPAPRH